MAQCTHGPTKTVPQTVATFYLMLLKWPRADMHTTRTKYFEVYHQSSHQDGHSNNPFASSYLLLKLHCALHRYLQDKQSLIYFINPESMLNEFDDTVSHKSHILVAVLLPRSSQTVHYNTVRLSSPITIGLTICCIIRECPGTGCITVSYIKPSSSHHPQPAAILKHEPRWFLGLNLKGVKTLISRLSTCSILSVLKL